jgi:hypothetical protein
MPKLNQYAISKILGSTMMPLKGPRFGHFGVLKTTAEVLKARNQAEREQTPARFTLADDRRVVKAFEDVRDGASTDALLWDTKLAGRFVERCSALGLAASPALLVRRLIHIRKNPAKYGQHRIRLSKTTHRESHESIVPQYAHVIEFALVRLRYRYGAAIDTVLADPELGREFEDLAHQVAPELTSEQIRLGALYIRKTRHFDKRTLGRAKDLDLTLVENAMTPPVSLARVSLNRVPAAPGLLELKEEERYLYVARQENLRPAVEQLRTGGGFSILANGLWQPKLEKISFRFVQGREVAGVPTSLWELRLIHDQEPVFNWPMPKQGGEGED